MPDIAHTPIVPRPTQKPNPRPYPIDPNWESLKQNVDANNQAIQDVLAKLNTIKSQPGEQGVSGPIGQTGQVGQAGPIGQAGPTGMKGTRGNTGPKGPAGQQGPQGLVGQAGRGVYDLTDSELGMLAKRLAPHLPPITFHSHGRKDGRELYQVQEVYLGGKLELHNNFKKRETNYWPST